MRSGLLSLLVACCTTGIALRKRDEPEREDLERKRPRGALEREEMEREELEGHNSLYLATHHKTGTELAHQAQECLSRVIPTRFDPTFTASLVWHKNVRVIHFVRNGFSLLVSAYIYHKNVGEAWSKKKDSSSGVVEKIIKLMNGNRRAAGLREGKDLNKKGESYTAFLQRVGTKIGVLAEMVRSEEELDTIESTDKQCHSRSSMCMNVCMEQFTESSHSYDATWEKIIKFGSVDGNHAKLMKCLRKSDLQRHPGNHAGHRDTLGIQQVSDIIKQAKEYDTKYFKRRWGKISEGVLSCNYGKTNSLLDGNNDDALTNDTLLEQDHWDMEESYA